MTPIPEVVIRRVAGGSRGLTVYRDGSRYVTYRFEDEDGNDLLKVTCHLDTRIDDIGLLRLPLEEKAVP
jgi:hypothetical protein